MRIYALTKPYEILMLNCVQRTPQFAHFKTAIWLFFFHLFISADIQPFGQTVFILLHVPDGENAELLQLTRDISALSSDTMHK